MLQSADLAIYLPCAVSLLPQEAEVPGAAAELAAAAAAAGPAAAAAPAGPAAAAGPGAAAGLAAAAAPGGPAAAAGLAAAAAPAGAAAAAGPAAAAGAGAAASLSQLDQQFAAFAYPPNTAVANRWRAEEETHAKQIVAVFSAHCAGLRDKALYNGCQAAAVAGYSTAQVQETRAAKQQLLATFRRCFAYRYPAGADKAAAEKTDKKFRDKIRQLLKHR